MTYCQIQGLVHKFQQGRDVETLRTVPLCSRILWDSLCLCLRSPWGNTWQMDMGDKQCHWWSSAPDCRIHQRRGTGCRLWFPGDSSGPWDRGTGCRRFHLGQGSSNLIR